ncbi:MAG TPA: ABC transporter ATP-binding protein [Thermoleophilaceae bacterium]|jgi:putative ABC transport system ATP-binding protein
MSVVSAERPAGEAPALRLDHVTRVFRQGANEVHALADVSMSIYPGEVTAVMGPSGSGKTTLLQIAGAMDLPSSGRVFHGETDLAGLDAAGLSRLRRQRIGFVFQFFNLMPGLTALENVALVARLDNVSRAKSAERARALLARVGLEGRADHLPSALSGGEQQRVAVARALVNRPRLVLADEPTGNLDRRAGASVVEVLVEAAREQRAAVLIVTHDAVVHDYVERTMTMADGRVSDSGEVARTAQA